MSDDVREPGYLAVVYHDDEDNAATDSKAEWHETAQEAAAWARRRMTEPYWNGYPSTIHSGFVVHDPVPRWEDDDKHLWLVYADHEEQER